MKNLIALLFVGICAINIDYVDSRTDKNKSLVVVTFEDGSIDRLQVDKKDLGSDAVVNAVMQIIDTRQDNKDCSSYSIY